MKYIKNVGFVFVLTIILSACSNGGFHSDYQYEIEDFDATNQRGETINQNDLKNDKVTLVDFIFTNCITVCPPMTYNMSQIQGMLDEEGVTDYQIVSFSVDPENDSPEVLSEYISNYEANEENWHLLTGYKQEFISQLALNSFKTIVQNDPTSDQVIHGVNFYLVDQNGTVVKDYQGNEEVPMDMIVSDVKALIKAGPVE